VVDKEKLKLKVAGREIAQSFLEISPELPSLGPVAIAAFFDELRGALLPEVVAQESVARARKLSELADYRLEFGAHSGKPLSDVPRDYLHWLVDVTEENLRAVSQYLELTADSEERGD
jgi:uncharacterized protein (DUF3820 family)